MIRLARFLYPYRFSLVGVVLQVFLQALSDLYLPTLMADIVDIGVVKGNYSYILNIGAFMLVVAIALFFILHWAALLVSPFFIVAAILAFLDRPAARTAAA